jgi:hypothetical protein
MFTVSACAICLFSYTCGHMLREANETPQIKILSKTRMAELVRGIGIKTPEIHKSWADIQEALRKGTDVIIRDELPASIGRDYAGDSGVLDSHVLYADKVLTKTQINNPDNHLETIIAEFNAEIGPFLDMGLPDDVRVNTRAEQRMMDFINAHILFLDPHIVTTGFKTLADRRARLYANKKGIDPDVLLEQVQYRGWSLENKDGVTGSIVRDKSTPDRYHITLRRRSALAQEKNREQKITFDAASGEIDIRSTFPSGDISKNFIRACSQWYERIKSIDEFVNDNILVEFGIDANLQNELTFYQAHQTSHPTPSEHTLQQGDVTQLESQGFKKAIMVQGVTPKAGFSSVMPTDIHGVDTATREIFLFTGSEAMNLEIMSRHMKIVIHALQDVESTASHHIIASLMYKPELYVGIPYSEVIELNRKGCSSVRVSVISDGKICYYKIENQ